ncbi:MAG TPA: hypothetical protein DCS43_04790 [Verrucomicrobia bacterium]|nr:hypothetical protein [Verrucomicrobiota bacterium]
MGSKLLPKLAINAVDEIRIATGSDTVRVVRTENGWVLPERYNYPANFETVKQFMIKLADLKIGQVVKANDAQRQKMGFSSDSVVNLTLKAGANEIVTLAMGATRQTQGAQASPYGSIPDGRYVAIKGDPAVYLIGDAMNEASAQPSRWLDTALLDITPEDVSTITLENPEDGIIVLRRDDQGKVDFDPADAATPFDESKAYGLSGALNYLSFQEVADPSLDDAALGFATARTFTLKTKAGIRYQLRVSDRIGESSERYIRIKATADQPAAAATADGGDDTAKKEADKTLAAKADELNKRFAPWTYKIASYKADTLVSTRESLIKKPDPAPAEAAETTTTTEGIPHE